MGFLDEKKYTVNLFVPCCMDMFTPSTPFTILRLLEDTLHETCYYNSAQTCCGRQFFLRGEKESAKELGYNLMTYFGNGLPIVAPSAACVGYIKKYFKELFSTTAVPSILENMIRNTYEICDYIVNYKQVECLGNTFEHRVFYFQTCASRNVCHSIDEALTLLKNTNGLTLLTDPDMHICCSANGDFAQLNNEMSDYFLGMIVKRIKEFEPEYITGSDLHCLQYIDAYLQAHGDDTMEVIPLPDILCSTGEQSNN